MGLFGSDWARQVDDRDGHEKINGIFSEIFPKEKNSMN